MKVHLARVAAGISAVALSLAGIVAGAGLAQADIGPDQPNHPTSGSLVIHKAIGAEGAASDGTEQKNIKGKPLKDATFTIWQLGKMDAGQCKALDLTTADAWKSVPTGTAPKTIDDVKTDFCLVAENGTAQTTNDNGETTFANLALGLYYVQETGAPANIVSKTAPFYVSIPLPHKDLGWLYTVHAYPKNQEADKPSKTINTDDAQAGVTVGSIVEWTITQTVPALNTGETYTSASIWDNLTDGLEYVETKEVTYDGQPLTLTDDYTFNQQGQNLTWALTEKARNTLQANKTITVKFTTKVTKVTQTGDIDNPGSEGPDKPGYGSEFNGNKLPGGKTPHTYWGQLSILKTDDSTPAKNLKGAEFQVFNNYANGACPALPSDGSQVATGTSDENGVVQWQNVTPTSPLGLWVANSPDGPLQSPTKTYCLYETKVPAGHTPGADFANGAGKAVVITPGTGNVQALTVVNPKKDGPDLPLTGAQGTLLLTVIGLGLAGGGAALAITSRRKRNG